MCPQRLLGLPLASGLLVSAAAKAEVCCRPWTTSAGLEKWLFYEYRS